MHIKISNLTQKVARRDAANEQYHGGEPRAFRGLKMADTCQDPSIQERLFNISVNTDQIGMGFEADTPEKNESNMSIFSDFRTKIW